MVSTSAKMISLNIITPNARRPILFSIVYVKCCKFLRRSLWSELVTTSRYVQGPWAVAGDFNAVTSAVEWLGASSSDTASSDEFKIAILDAELTDVGFSGNRYTWSNNRATQARLWAKSDRVLLNDHWLSAFTNFRVEYLVRSNSDHAPFRLCSPGHFLSSPRPFRFLRMWTLHDGFMQIVKEAWTGNLSSFPLINV